MIFLALFQLSFAAQKLAVLDMTCAEQSSRCQTFTQSLRKELKRQLDSSDVQIVPREQMLQSLRGRDPFCDFNSCEGYVGQVLPADWVINGRIDDKASTVYFSAFDVSKGKTVGQSQQYFAIDEKTESRIASSVSTLLESILPDQSADASDVFTDFKVGVEGRGKITVQSSVGEMQFLIDDKKIMQTPFELELDAGVHTVVSKDPCNWSKDWKFLLKDGENLNRTFEAAPIVGLLDVKLNTEAGEEISAEVFIDEKAVGRTPYHQNVSICASKLTLRTDTHFWTKDFQLKDGQMQEHHILLKDMDLVVEPVNEKIEWGCKEKYAVASAATFGGGLLIGLFTENIYLTAISLAAAPVYYFGRWTCEKKESESSESSESSGSSGSSESTGDVTPETKADSSNGGLENTPSEEVTPENTESEKTDSETPAESPVPTEDESAHKEKAD